MLMDMPLDHRPRGMELAEDQLKAELRQRWEYITFKYDCCEFIISLNKITMFVLIIFAFWCALLNSNKVCVSNDTCIDPIPRQSNEWTVSSFSPLQDTLRVNPTLGAYPTLM